MRDPTPTKSNLISIADDMVVRYWGIGTYQCAHSEYDQTNQDWAPIFAASPELTRKFLVEGIRSPSERQDAQLYMGAFFFSLMTSSPMRWICSTKRKT
jgi:hypothetical protein